MLIVQIADLAASLDGDAFVARLPMPVLVPAELIATGESGAGFLTPPGGISLHKTPKSLTASDIACKTRMDAESSSSSRVRPVSDQVGDAEVILLAKSDRNPFVHMITVGRSPNNDVVLHDKAVSKMHAYFIEKPEGWFIYDQSSTNGTFVDGVRATAAGTRLADGCLIAFGSRVSVRFYTPRALHGFLCHAEG